MRGKQGEKVNELPLMCRNSNEVLKTNKQLNCSALIHFGLLCMSMICG